MKASEVDAYRYFFPAGWILGIWGVLLWILFPWNLVQYPGLSHPEIMMGGFFLCFVCGFLMTAIPRFTGTFGPSKFEHGISGAGVLLLFSSLAFAQKVYFYGAVLLLLLFLMSYLGRRFVVRKNNPPDSFLFVGAGVLLAFLGSFILFIAEFFPVPSQLLYFARLSFLQAYILCLVLGVGTRLIPALLGWAPLPTESKAPSRLKLMIVLAVLFVGSYLIEAFVSAAHGNLCRAVLMTGITLYFWKIYKLPKRKAIQTFSLWASAWLLLLAQWGIVFVPNARVHILHILYVSGLALMTFMIATRVTLSHGQHDMTLEKKSKALGVGAALVLFAGLTRWSAGFSPEIYQSHLLYAAYTWILGLLVWGWVFLPKMIQVKESKPGHET